MHEFIAPWTEYSRFFIALLVILDPFIAIPVFLTLTAGYTKQEKLATSRVTSLTVMSVLLVSALLGETILQWMGTSIGSFRVGGGIVLFLMALAMLQAQPDPVRVTESEELSAEDKDTIGVVPLAIPLLAGPGAISTVIIASHRSDAPWHIVPVLACIVLVCFVLFLVLNYSHIIGEKLGDIGIKVVNRIFGLILVAIAVEVITNGIKQLFPQLL